MTSLSQRSSGVVQRRKTQARENAEGGNSEPDDVGSRDLDGYDDDDGDSKETRLTLMEEILLLGLKDREVMLLY